MHDRRRKQHAQQRDRDERGHHGAEHLLAESPRGDRTVLVANAHRHRHIGGIERAFGEQPAEQIGDLQRREIGIGQGAGAEQRRNARIAQETEQARRKRRGADGGDIARNRHVASGPESSRSRGGTSVMSRKILR
jgi:hypothetical protein